MREQFKKYLSKRKEKDMTEPLVASISAFSEKLCSLSEAKLYSYLMLYIFKEFSLFVF